mmetsp:Transcript_107670/g.347522  ORF Transcript_107670/g.347522 Transcript_107670/m.347522 type:complete len:224 (+) Transcript_107670:1287-1958(+)
MRSTSASSSSLKSQLSPVCRSPGQEPSAESSLRREHRAESHACSSSAAWASRPPPKLQMAAATLARTSCRERSCAGARRRRSGSLCCSCTSSCRTPATWNQQSAAGSSPGSVATPGRPKRPAASWTSASRRRASAASFRACASHSARCWLSFVCRFWLCTECCTLLSLARMSPSLALAASKDRLTLGIDRRRDCRSTRAFSAAPPRSHAPCRGHETEIFGAPA